MDTNLILVKCITLLYLESETEDFISESLCKDAIDTLNIDESLVDTHGDGEIILCLRTLIYWLIDNVNKGPINKRQLLQRLRVSVKEQGYLYESIASIVNEETDKESLTKTIMEIRDTLKSHVSAINIKAILKKNYGSIMNSKPSEIHKTIRELHTTIEPYTHNFTESQHAGIVDAVDFNEPNEILDLLARCEVELSNDGTLKFGYQAINRMLGSARGARRGEFILVGALQHNFKTGFTLNLFKQVALYNKPYMRDPKKKPLLLHFSLENELPMNVMWLYVNLKENETGVKCDVSNVNIEEATKYIVERMGVNGYNIAMVRLDPNAVGIFDLIDIMLKYIADGYEIHLVVCDYVNMVNRSGIDKSGPMGTEIRSLMRIMRNFTSSRGITFITPHQLSTEAKNLVRDDIPDFVQFIANKGYYDGSKQIDQEVDLELIIHIEIIGGVSYLTVQRGKHRKLEITPEKDKYTVLPFHPVGGVLDDINGTDLSLKRPGGKRNVTGDKVEVKSESTETEDDWFS